MNVKDIVAAHLRSIGADGLCNFECGCGLDDLMPCVDGAISECVPAKRGPVPEEYKDECSEWFVPMEVTR